MTPISQRIAEELNVKTSQVEAAVALLDEGATVPFISRYRKEVTGELDDTQLRTLEERLRYLRELEERRATILASVQEPATAADALVEPAEYHIMSMRAAMRDLPSEPAEVFERESHGVLAQEPKLPLGRVKSRIA